MTNEQEAFRTGYIDAYMGLPRRISTPLEAFYMEGRKAGRAESDFGLRNDLHDYAMAAMGGNCD